MKEIRQIYYRGSLKFCNYSCSYCPFSKGKRSERQLSQDSEELSDFVDKLGESGFRGAVQIVPYGEALIHEYYWEALAKMSCLPGVEAVGAQSNFSFPVARMLEVFEANGGLVEKLRLWGTFHPEMVSVEVFAEQCERLSDAGVLFCVGTVGVPENINVVRSLRERLDSSVYLWVNKMDGLGRKYTLEERQAFSEIDAYFDLELRRYKADARRCKNSILVDGKGDVYGCNLCHFKMGNIYRGDVGAKLCRSRECDCYISYCNRDDMEELIFFQPYPAFRIPNYKRAVFFDIDGTLVFEGEREISARRTAWLRGLAKHSDVYLVTSLPFEDAMRKIHPVADVIKGGVFAGGGRIRWREKCGCEPKGKNGDFCDEVWKEKLFPVDVRVLELLRGFEEEFEVRIREYKRSGVVYKVVLSFPGKASNDKVCGKIREKIEDDLSKNGAKNRDFLHIITEENKMQITASGTGKLAGIQFLCGELGMTLDDIAVFGNSESDIEMLRAVPFSVAVAGSDEKVREAARYKLF